ncbi:hypothetical protein PBI_LLAMA_80 [Mycobacterium phage Llama]|uniref:hypothetical protein n=1 Tax=Mycobacterium phage Llama TaxID=1541823 RepID=UPI0004F74BDC|nr:hypothetical protein PBI_LLAMA_80 [Mycobacterium phage Llama]AIM51022.1 hypothetical protein PBI_LLAMA_80 [Mycobacterium phage Llama]
MQASAKHCLEAMPPKQCTYVTYVLTKNYSPLVSRLTLGIARRGGRTNFPQMEKILAFAPLGRSQEPVR